MPPVSLGQLASEIELLYAPPTRSASTRTKARQVLRLVEQLGVRSTEELTPVLLAKFCAAEHAAGCRPITIRGYLSYLRPIARYAVAMGYTERDPFLWRAQWVRDDGERVTRSCHHSAAAIGQVLKILGARVGTWEGHRLYALVMTVAHTGLRRTEALTLRVEDVDPARGLLHVRGRRRLKTVNSAAPVPMAADLGQVLARWIPRLGDCPWLFPGVRGAGPWIGGGIGGRAIDQVRQAGLDAGVPGFTLLSLRHSWATHAEGLWGFSEVQIQRVLRHTTPRTQQHYRHADESNVAAWGRRIRFPG